MKTLIGVMIGLFVLFLIVIIGGFGWYVSTRNGLIAREVTVKEAWAQIDIQLQRRADLIPNLVNTVKGYAKHEKEVFASISQARSRLLSAKGPKEKAEASGMMNATLGRLLAIAENYPNLKADTSFIRLQDELAGTENRIAVARTRYNQAVKNYNYAIRSFSGSFLAGSLGLEKAEFYQPPDSAKIQNAPVVNLD